MVDVISSKPGDCPADSTASVDIAALQEMHNQFREHLDAGVKMLADNQTNGLPQGPAAGARAVPEGTAMPAADAGSQLAAQQNNAGNIEGQTPPSRGN